MRSGGRRCIVGRRRGHRSERLLASWILIARRCGEFVLPGVAKLVVQQRQGRMGRNPATGATVEIPAKQVVKARIAKQLRDVLEAQTYTRQRLPEGARPSGAESGSVG